MKKRAWLLWLVLVVLVGCGGGGGSTDEPSSASTSSASILKVVSTSPVDSATGVAVDAVISATLDEDVDPASVISADFSVAQDKAVVGVVSSSGKSVSFVPGKNLSALSTCVVMLSGLKGKSGKTMDKPFVWAFTTGVAPGTAPPTVVPLIISATYPRSGEIVPVTAKISPHFSEKVDITSLNLDNFKVTNVATKAVVPGKFSLGELTQVNFTPDELLASKANYQAEVKGVKSLTGNIMTEPYSWNFSTADSTVTLVATLNPADGVFYSAGGAAQATYDKATGTVNVNTDDISYEVSVRWSPIAIEMKTYRAVFSCSSEPQDNWLEAEFKKAVNPTGAYATEAFSCDGRVVVDLAPNQVDLAGRYSINFGRHKGKKVIGPVKLYKIE